MIWLIKTEKQKKNIAKFSYDIAKIILAITVITPIAKSTSFNINLFFGGIIIAIVFFLFGNLLDSKDVAS